MKNLLLTIFALAGNYIYAQITPLVINNYSNFYLNTRFAAAGVGGGGCYPLIQSSPPSGSGIYTIPPAPGGGMPFSVGYNSYDTSNSSSIPLVQWLVSTSSTTSGYRPYNHTSLNQSGIISTSTDWSYFAFLTHTGNNMTIDNFYLKLPPCNSTVVSYITGSQSDAEWFTITSGGNTTTYVQIY